MKKENNLTTGISEPEKVVEFMNKLEHPLYDVVQNLRDVILSTDKKIGEGIYWNAPTFYYTGSMKPFDAKEYKRYIVGFNLFKQDSVRLIFLRGAGVDDPTGLLEGDYKDGRRLAQFKNIGEVKKSGAALKKIIKRLLKSIDK